MYRNLCNWISVAAILFVLNLAPPNAPALIYTPVDGGKVKPNFTATGAAMAGVFVEVSLADKCGVNLYKGKVTLTMPVGTWKADFSDVKPGDYTLIEF